LRRPHKRKRATCLKGKCVEYVGDNLHAVFEAGVLDIKLRVQILEYLCENPVLVDLPDGGWLPRRARARFCSRAQAPARPGASSTGTCGRVSAETAGPAALEQTRSLSGANAFAQESLALARELARALKIFPAWSAI
jgi:hypothetical protein